MSFRFNHTDGDSIGFRVIGLNVLDDQGKHLLPRAIFAQENPDLWTAPLTSASDLQAGEKAWRTATLRTNYLAGTGNIQAHCGDCHSEDGRDLKYFNFSNHSIIERSKFHGLSEMQGEQIASYIRSLNVPSPGRVWNPPYQPGPGLDAKPVEEWSAGAGIDWVLDNDNDTLPYVFPNGVNAGAITEGGTFKRLNMREIPVALLLPDWLKWLPRVYPLDAVGTAFTTHPNYGPLPRHA